VREIYKRKPQVAPTKRTTAKIIPVKKSNKKKLQMIKKIKIKIMVTQIPPICLANQTTTKPAKRRKKKWNSNLKKTKRSGVKR